MLTPIELTLFALLVLVCAVAAYNTWGQTARIINKGQGQLELQPLPQRIGAGISALFSQGNIISHRRIVSIFHYGVAYAFIFYGLVTITEVLEGVLPSFNLLNDNFVGDFFHLFTDLFSVSAIIAALFFLIRRFARQDPALKTRENVKLNPKAREGGIATDSLIVILFLLLHMSGTLLTSSAALALEGGGDLWRPVSSALSSVIMSGMSESALIFLEHAGWWISIGLVILFIPYFHLPSISISSWVP
jgi:hypothetical protein